MVASIEVFAFAQTVLTVSKTCSMKPCTAVTTLDRAVLITVLIVSARLPAKPLSIADDTCVLVDTVRKSLHEVRHPALEISERSLIRHGEVQERFDLVCYTLYCIRYLADTVFDTADNVVDDICAPLECL